MNVGGNFTMNVVIANERSFRRLDAATQKVVMDAAAEAETRGWKMSQDVTAEHLKLMAEKGMTISTPDAKFLAELEPVGKTLTAEWLKKAGALLATDYRRLSQVKAGGIRSAERPPRRPSASWGSMRKALDLLYLACGVLGGFFLALIGGVILYQVFGRNLGLGIPGVDDLAALFLVASAFLSLAHTLRAGGHIRVNLLLLYLPQSLRRVAELWCLAFGAGLMGFLTYFTIDMAWEVVRLWRSRHRPAAHPHVDSPGRRGAGAAGVHNLLHRRLYRGVAVRQAQLSGRGDGPAV